MKIEIVRRIPFSELAKKIRHVPLVQKDSEGSERYVYKNARVSVKTFHPDEVNPTTFYLLKKGLEFQTELHETMIRDYGIDTLNLDAGYEIRNEKGEIWGLIPPIVEITPRRVRYVAGKEEISYKEAVTIQIPIINDGAHRVWMAREKNNLFKALCISGADPEFPFYAHPNEWSRVKLVDEVPKDKREKKFYSRENSYGLYRDFGILGCGAPRSIS